MQLITNENQKEIKNHGSFAYPIRISYESLTLYEQESFNWHWHPEIELTYIVKGEMLYQINQNIYHVQAGNALFCNSNALHTGHAVSPHQNCEYISLTFHPRVLYGYEGSEIETSYVRPIIDQASMSSILFTVQEAWQKEIITLLLDIIDMNKEKNDAYQLQTQIELLQIWLCLYKHNVTHPVQTDLNNEKNLERLRHILDYIHEHYSEPITLDEIARQVSLCKSECCRFFKKQMNQTLFEYLIDYRISMSLPLLRSGMNITEAGLACGFANPAYYSRVFKKQIGCAPRDYTKKES